MAPQLRRGPARKPATLLWHGPYIPVRSILGHLDAASGCLDSAGGVRSISVAGAIVAAGLAAGVAAAKSSPVKAEEKGEDGRKKADLSFAQIAKMPRPGAQSIGTVTFLPDSSHVLYLKSEDYGSLKRQLYATEVDTGVAKQLACTPPNTGEEKELSLEEKLRRERARVMNTGVTSFKVAGSDGSHGCVLVPMGGALYVREGLDEGAEMRLLFDPTAPPLGPGAIIDPQISDDGSLVCFVWQDEVYCVPTDGSAPPRALTGGARGTGRTHGLADFLAQEELDRYEGFWISPDGSQVAYEEVDESHIPQFRIMHSGSDVVGEGAQEDHRYPFAGNANPKVKLFVTGSKAASTGTQFDLTGPFGEEFYLARVQWVPHGKLVAQILNREQTRLAVLALDIATGRTQTLFTEETKVWVNVHNMLKPIGTSGRLLWASERSGFRHLFVYDVTTGLRPITKGHWQVEEVVAVDESAGVVYFMGTSEASWLERHLFAVPLDGSAAPKQVTSEPGMHEVCVDGACKTFVDVRSALDCPSVATLRSLEDGRELHTIYKNEDPKIAEMALPAPELVTFPSADGKVTLQAALYKPDSTLYGPGPYPTVVSCYGGPHVQFIDNSWRMTVDLRAQAMRSRGCLVLKVDNRGGRRRGLDFEAPLKFETGVVEVDDQVAGVRWCVGQGLTDKTRVGIYGWSYGGYLSAMCLAKAADVFKCAVAGAPVTHWDGYDTCYTERYMGTPQGNPKGYQKSSVIEHAGGIKGDLLLVHGLIDENVHFRHTARLINALIAERKPYQLLLFPNERHSPRGHADREFMEERIWAFIRDSLAV
eukprot:TRINITY_DN26433_c0_g1_i1.p1 TRINITY_DN26433_c0_g1~~TRINITY_DN26433_c0_g1_i1.p1  ORF type:complete len:860 (-),score=124.28 TRINITY_DN26433_c0_g1_i1:70-2523(-)